MSSCDLRRSSAEFFLISRAAELFIFVVTAMCTNVCVCAFLVACSPLNNDAVHLSHTSD